MASTTFTDQQTVIYAAWLNDVNNAVYNGAFPNGILNVTTVNATNVNATNFGFTSITLPNNWSITTSSTKLYFAFAGVNVASIDSSGNFTALNNVNAVNVNGSTSVVGGSSPVTP
jgi:hypothetical protein